MAGLGSAGGFLNASRGSVARHSGRQPALCSHGIMAFDRRVGCDRLTSSTSIEIGQAVSHQLACLIVGACRHLRQGAVR